MRPVGDKCECWPVENPWTHYGIVEPGGALEFNPDCPEHGRDADSEPSGADLRDFQASGVVRGASEGEKA